jgi:hypothetical protein
LAGRAEDGCGVGEEGVGGGGAVVRGGPGYAGRVEDGRSGAVESVVEGDGWP